MGRYTVPRSIADIEWGLKHCPLKLERAILFGSRARGDFWEESDWDLLIISPDFREIPFIKRAEFLLKTIPLFRIQYFCYTPEEFQEGIGIIPQALAEGIEITIKK